MGQSGKVRAVTIVFRFCVKIVGTAGFTTFTLRLPVVPGHDTAQCDLNARPPAPKLDGFPLYHSPVPKTFNNLGRLLSLSRHPFAYQHEQ